MKRSLIVLAAAVAGATPAFGQMVESFEFVNGVGGVIFNNGGIVPDASPVGWSDTRTVSTPGTQILDVDVILNFSGGYNGDLYGYLSGPGGGFSVLFNRVGRTEDDPFGYGDSGLNLTLDDDAAGDIHSYRASILTLNDSGQLTGRWQPDGRNGDPASVTDQMARTAFLSSFVDLNPNGNWTLFIADLSAGETTQVESWGLQISAVPEPAEVGMAIGVALGAFALWRKRRSKAA